MSILEVKGISKSFNGFMAVKDISFKINPGRIHGILGPNGAGKTTTIRMIMNIIVPDSGTISLFDQSMNDQLKCKIGYLPEERGLYQKMKVKELIYFLAELHRMDLSYAKDKCAYWLNKMQLSDKAEAKVEELSKGMQQKIQIISTIIHEPDLIILDEPFSGLDPVNVNLIKNVMIELKEQNKAIMFSTHMMEAAEKLCDEVIMINRGEKILDGNLETIRNEYGKNSIQVEFEGDGKFIKSLPMINKCDYYSNYVELELAESYTINDLLQALLDKIKISQVKSQSSSLNEIFIALAEGGIRP
ncbi:MAG: ATP-binding cassette domain-containing protein [Calditrichaceae bacterium]|nr:ATP-binding cassette domain-containing protein [Calditrichaceae bacterium]